MINFFESLYIINSNILFYNKKVEDSYLKYNLDCNINLLMLFA